MKRTLYSLPQHCLLQKIYAKLGKCVHCGAFEIKRCRDKALERKIKQNNDLESNILVSMD